MWIAPRDAVRFEFFPVGMLLFGAVGAAALGRAGIIHFRSILLALAYGMGIITAVSIFSPQIPRVNDYRCGYALLCAPSSPLRRTAPDASADPSGPRS